MQLSSFSLSVMRCHCAYVKSSYLARFYSCLHDRWETPEHCSGFGAPDSSQAHKNVVSGPRERERQCISGWILFSHRTDFSENGVVWKKYSFLLHRNAYCWQELKWEWEPQRQCTFISQKGKCDNRCVHYLRWKMRVMRSERILLWDPFPKSICNANLSRVDSWSVISFSTSWIS